MPLEFVPCKAPTKHAEVGFVNTTSDSGVTDPADSLGPGVSA